MVLLMAVTTARLYAWNDRGGLCCGREKGPSGHSVNPDRTPLSFSYTSYIPAESSDLVVQYSAHTVMWAYIRSLLSSCQVELSLSI